MRFLVQKNPEFVDLPMKGDNEHQWTPLMLAAAFGKLSMVQFLLDHGANLSNNVFIEAACSGQYEVTRFLLDRNPEFIDVQDDHGTTLLMRLAEMGLFSMVQLLLDYNADCFLQDCDGETVLHYAAEGGHKEIIRLLTNKVSELAHFSISHDSVTPLMEAARYGHFEAVEFFLSLGFDASVRDFCGYNAFHCSAEGGHVELVNFLAESAPNLIDTQVNQEHQEKTALMLAVEKGHLSVVKLLLQRGANCSLTDSEGNTALHHAVTSECYNQEIVKMLLVFGASIQTRNSLNHTPMECLNSDSKKQQKIQTFYQALRNVTARFNQHYQALTEEPIKTQLKAHPEIKANFFQLSSPMMVQRLVTGGVKPFKTIQAQLRNDVVNEYKECVDLPREIQDIIMAYVLESHGISETESNQLCQFFSDHKETLFSNKMLGLSK